MPLLVLPPRTSTLMQQHTTISSAECLARLSQEESILVFFLFLWGIRISNMGILLLLQAMYENLLVELPLAPFFLSKILGNVTLKDYLQVLLPQARLSTLIIWTHWIQSSTGTCSHWRLLRAMSRFANVILSKIGFNILTILGQLWHRFHCCGGGVWSDQDRIAQAWGRFHTSNFWEQVDIFSFCFSISGRLLKSIFPRIEYIHLVADYKLNRQIKAQCSAFRCCSHK